MRMRDRPRRGRSPSPRSSATRARSTIWGSPRITHASTVAYASAPRIGGDRCEHRRLLEQVRGRRRVHAPEAPELGASAQVEIDGARIGRPGRDGCACRQRRRRSHARAFRRRRVPRPRRTPPCAPRSGSHRRRRSIAPIPAARSARGGVTRTRRGRRRDVFRARADRSDDLVRTMPAGRTRKPAVDDSVSTRSSRMPSARYSSARRAADRQHRERGRRFDRRWVTTASRVSSSLTRGAGGSTWSSTSPPREIASAMSRALAGRSAGSSWRQRLDDARRTTPARPSNETAAAAWSPARPRS